MLKKNLLIALAAISITSCTPIYKKMNVDKETYAGLNDGLYANFQTSKGNMIVKLEDKKARNLIKILNRCGVNTIPHEILAGAVLEAVKAYEKNDSRVSTWKSEGLKVLKPGRGKKKFI